MARPIETTPTIKDEEARKIIKEIESSRKLSTKKEKDLERCHSLYIKFPNQRHRFAGA